MWRLLYEDAAKMCLYYVLLHWWMNLGQSEFALRSLSVIFALATVPVTYAIGKCTVGKRVGIVSALLLTVNAFFLRYAQEARGYSFVLLLVTLSSYFFVKSVQRPSWKLWIAYIASSVLAGYAHIYACLVLIAHAISLAFLRRRDVPWRQVAIGRVLALQEIIALRLRYVARFTRVIGLLWHPHTPVISQRF